MIAPEVELIASFAFAYMSISLRFVPPTSFPIVPTDCPLDIKARPLFAVPAVIEVSPSVERMLLKGVLIPL